MELIFGISDRRHINSKRKCSPELKNVFIPEGGWAILDLALSPDSRFGAASSWGPSVQLFQVNSDQNDTNTQPLPMPAEENGDHRRIC